MKPWLLFTGAVGGLLAIVVNFIKKYSLLDFATLTFILLSVVALTLVFVKLKGDVAHG